MKKYKKNGVEWLEFDLLANHKNVTHAVFLRHGGVSQNPYNSLNSCDYIGDNSQAVQTNVSIIQNTLQTNALKKAYHIHGKEICTVNKHSEFESHGYDGLMTYEVGIGLLVTHADCQAAIFYDPINKAIANIHSGWRGNVQNIYKEAIIAMGEKYGSKPSNLLVCISPSLGPEYSEFINYKTELPESFWSFQVKPNYFDLWSISEMQLRESGILSNHIEIAKICTYANSEDFFSYRRDKKTGRNATCIALKSF